MILVEKHASGLEVAYVICMAQLVSILVFFWKEGMYVFDVPLEGRSILTTRSVIYCGGILLLMKSMEFLNPMVALMAHQLGMFTAITVGRLLYRDGKERWFLLACIKFFVTGLLLI